MAGHLGRVLVEGKDRGGGSALGPRLVVTANYVVRGVEDQSVVYVPTGGEAVTVERMQVDVDHNAAILWLTSDVGEFLPTSAAQPGARWQSPPAGANDPALTGTISTVRMTIQNAGGQQVEMMQLLVDQQVGDYSGYSGSAVLDSRGQTVLALLVEQGLQRTPAVLGERQAASNVLYAVPIADVITALGLPGANLQANQPADSRNDTGFATDIAGDRIRVTSVDDLIAAREVSRLRDLAGNRDDAPARYRAAELAGDIATMRNIRRIQRAADRTARAEATFRHAVRRGDASAMRELGRLLEAEGNTSEAEEMYRQAVDAGDTSAKRYLGRLLELTNDLREAELLYRQALAEGDVLAMRELGRLLEAEGNTSEAEEMYRNAVESGEVPAARELGRFFEEQEEFQAADEWMSKWAQDRFDRLSTEAVTAFAIADELRLHLDEHEVEMEHLLSAMSQQEDGPAQRLLARAGGRRVLAAAIDEATGASLPEVSGQSSLSSLPPVSDRVAEALDQSVEIAGEAQSNLVQGWQLLLGALSISDSGIIEALADRGVAAADLAAGADLDEPPWPSRLAGASADTVPEPGKGRVRAADRLGAATEVEMLASVLLAKDTPLPLAVGLFGDWGSGKSFFMALMYERIDELAKLAEDRRPEALPFCSQVRQVRFNAWHYSDSNLWASLADALFDQLAQVDALDQAQAKLEELDEARKHVLDARRRREDLERQVHDLERPDQPTLRAPVSAAIFGVRDEPVVENLKALRDESVSEDLEGIRSEQAAGTIEAAGKEGAALADTIRLVSALGDIEGATEKAGMTLRLFWEEVLHRRRWATVACVVALVGFAAAAAAAAQWPTGLKVLTFIGALAVGISPALTAALRVLYFAREARNAAQLRLARKQEELAQAQADEKNAEQGVLRRQQELAELREPGLRLRQFVRERAASPVYRERLGVISQVRRDFEQLVAMISGNRPSEAEQAASSEDAGRAQVPEVERIILYIDDLDRCPHDKVVDVLQAVHLLLAFKLFVVVVGVDSEWLERSLRLHYPDLLDEPYSYLEKIFQIPFTLRRMTRTGYRHLIEELTPNETLSRRTADTGDSAQRDPAMRPEAVDGQAPEAAADIEPSRRPDAEATVQPGNVGSSDPTAVPAAIRVHETAATTAAEPEATAAEPEATAAEPATLPSPEALVISGPERDLLGRLGAIMATPRAAKRLVNIYRMLRVSILDEELALFMPGSGDEYQAVVLLLGILIGRSHLAKSVFEEIMAAEDDSDIWQILERHNEVYQALNALRDTTSLNRSAPYRRWAPRVSRFSFRLAEVIPADEASV